MTLEDFNTVLEGTGYPVAFRCFPKETSHNPPFICYITPDSDVFSADGKTYHKAQNVQVELYTADKDETAEATVEEALADFYYTKEEDYIDSERIYMVAYNLTL